MRLATRRDLSDSAHDFERVVWPVIGSWCRGGEIIAVESVTETPFAALIDQKAGIDYWQLSGDGAMLRGLAVRIQWGHNWDTFTVRAERDSGAKTELEKRIAALSDSRAGWLYPALTVQAYVERRRTGSLISAAVVRTKDLYEYVLSHDDGESWYYQRTSNATFIVVPWANLKAEAISLRTHHAPKEEAA